jgi:dihydrofolate synthase/folylpolyglutamate synthase
MNYTKTLEYLMEQLPMYQRVGKLAYRTGLDNTCNLDAYFGSPHRRFTTIHVGGTNGKGSVSHMLASILQESGYKTGLYTSPHLLDFRERIRVNGKMITQNFVTEFVSDHKPFFDTFNPSFFEISVFLAFTYFVHCQVDVAVIEVGLGGRLDATNIIKPALTVITNIGRDHTEILGDTPVLIAGEKAGIIKTNTPVVIGESQPETMPVFSQVASHRQAPLVIADDMYQIDVVQGPEDGCQVFDVKANGINRYPGLKCGLLGHYQRKNTVTVLAAVDKLKQTGMEITDKDVYQGVRKVATNTGLEGRWQVMSFHPLVVCDTAHNADGLKLLLQQVSETPFEKLHLIIGFVNDKDTGAILPLMPTNAEYYFTRLSVPRTMSETELAGMASQFGLRGTAYAGAADAYAAAFNNAGSGDMIVITGSNFLVADYIGTRDKGRGTSRD